MAERGWKQKLDRISLVAYNEEELEVMTHVRTVAQEKNLPINTVILNAVRKAYKIGKGKQAA